MTFDELKYEVIVKDGQKYEFIRLDPALNVTEENGGIPTKVTHVLEGFPDDLVIIVEEPAENEDNGSFYFGQKHGDTGLITQVVTEEVYNFAMNLLIEVLDRE